MSVQRLNIDNVIINSLQKAGFLLKIAHPYKNLKMEVFLISDPIKELLTLAQG